VVINSHWDCILIGGTSLDVSPACHYHSPPTLLLNVPRQVAAFWEIKKNLMQLRSWSFFILFIFHSNFYFLYSIQVSAAISGDPVLYNLELTVHVIIIFPQKLIRFHTIMFRIHSGVGLSVCWVLQRMRSYAIKGRRKVCIHACIALVGAMWEQWQMSFILLSGFLHNFCK